MMGKFLTVFLLILFSFHSRAQEIRCKSLVDGADPKRSKNLPRDLNYSRIIENPGEVKVQCGLLNCGLMTAISGVEQDFQNKYGFKIKISTEYLVVRNWLESAVDAIRRVGGSQDTGIQIGATVYDATALIKSYGVLPDRDWKHGSHFLLRSNREDLQAKLDQVIDKTRKELKEVQDPNSQNQIRQKAILQIESIFKNTIGEFPTTVKFYGRTYSLQDFTNEFFGNIDRPKALIRNTRSSKSTDQIVRLENGDLVFEAPARELESAIREVIDNNRAVYLVYKTHESLVDYKTNTYTLHAFTPEGLQGLKMRHHALQIVGYELDPKTNKVRRWLVKSSWGRSSGDRGFYHMQAAFFNELADHIVFPQDSHPNLPKWLLENNKK